MQLNIFAIRDSKAEQYKNLFLIESHGEAERAFSDTVNHEAQQNTMFHHPEDFDLYHLGQMDTETGKINSLPTPTHMIKAIHLKKSRPNLASVTQ